MFGTRHHRRVSFPTAIVVLAAALFASQAQAEDRALLIGIGQYQGGVTLPGVSDDPVLMRDIVKKMGFADNQIKLLEDRDATKAGILSSMKNWLGQSKAGERVVFYFSGHGSRVKDLNGDEADGCDEALVPYDLDNLLIDDELGEAIAALPSNNVLVVLDSCFSGTATKSQITGQSAGSRLRPKVLQKSGAMACDKAINISKGARGTGVVGLKEESLRVIPTPADPAPTARNQTLIEFDAAAPNEVALTDEGGSLFTLGLHEKVMATKGPVSFAELREYTAQYIRTKVNALGDIGFLAYHPQLQGPEALLSQNMLQFGRAAQAAPSLPEITAVNSGRELLDRYLNTSAFKVEIHSNQPTYKLGEAIRYQIYSSDDGYLNLLELDEQGNIAVLFPNKYNPNNQIIGGETNRFPSLQFGNYDFRAVEPYGKTRVVALITPEPLNLYNAPGNINGDFRVLLNVAQFQKLAAMLKATGVMPLPTGTTFGASSADIEVRP
ncbi:DUF4384 domain-containing protein [Deinococcus detaillensis]|uniref:DUF4384 domain-containing protein n=1 Tax=Deinococcus detaillensis TaxID=2592048 RepID=A0A553UNA2_9DEIO|nr:caspase family protein [Deinococcus detaillensis]TSA81431.1 DUF4384 domain-containing protein [Deinococcus detaillensis]